MKKLLVLLFIAASGLSAETWTLKCQSPDSGTGNQWVDVGIRWIQSTDPKFKTSCDYLCTGAIPGTHNFIGKFKPKYYSTEKAYNDDTAQQEYDCKNLP